MSVEMGWTTAMRMLLAITPSVALSVRVLLALMETELTAQILMSVNWE